MSDTPASPPTPRPAGNPSGEQHARSTKFRINVPPPPQRPDGGGHVPGAGRDELLKQLDLVVREQERLRYRLSNELQQSQRQQAERVESYSRQVTELNEQLAHAHDQLAEEVRLNHELERKQERLRAELSAQAQVNHELERKSLQERAELERLNFDRLAVAAEERERLRALIEEQAREIERLQREYVVGSERFADVSKALDGFQMKASTAEREASEARAALTGAESEVARLLRIVEDQEQSGATSRDQLRRAQEALEQSARHRAALEIKAREPARRNEIERERARTSPAGAKGGLLDRYFIGRSLKLARESMEHRDWRVAEPLLSVAAPRVDTASVWVQLGHARRELELYSGAASAYERAAEMAPQNGEIFVWLGICQERNGDLGAALAAYRRALEQLPTLAQRYGELKHLERLDGR